MDIVEKVFKISSCTEILANIKIYTTDQNVFYS